MARCNLLNKRKISTYWTQYAPPQMRGSSAAVENIRHPNSTVLDLTNFGWDMQNGNKENDDVVMLSVATNPTALFGLVDAISCSCKARQAHASSKCSCKADSLACMPYCICWDYDEIYLNTIAHTQKEGTQSPEYRMIHRWMEKVRTNTTMFTVMIMMMVMVIDGYDDGDDDEVDVQYVTWY